MVGDKTIGQVGAPKVGQKPSLLEERRQTKETELLAGLGLPDASRLGPNAQAAFLKIVSGDVEAISGKTSLESVKSAVARDFGQSFNPGKAPAGSVRVPEKAQLTQGAAEQGRFKLVGTLDGEAHPVRELLKSAGIDRTSFGPNVDKVINDSRGVDLAHAGNFAKLGRRLAEAKVKDTPISGLGSLLGASSIAQGGAVPSAGITGAADLGLAKTARAQGDKTTAGANAPDAVMHTESVRDPSLGEKRDTAVTRLSDLLSASGLPAAQCAEMRPLLDKVLKGGQLQAKDPTAKTWAIVCNVEREISGKAMPEEKPATHSKELANGAALIAASQVFDLAATKFGVDLDRTRMFAAAGVISDYTESTATTSKSGAGKKLGGINAPQRKAAGAKGAATASEAKGPKNGGAQVKRDAAAFAERLGIDPLAPHSAHLLKDIEAAFEKVHAGAKSDKDVAQAAFRYVDQQSGNSHLSEHAARVFGMGGDDPKIHTLMKEFALSRLTAFAALGPERYAAFAASQAAQAGNGAGGVPPGVMSMAGMAGGPGGQGGPGVPGMGIPGMPGMKMPEGMAFQGMQSRMRTIQASMILHDPALSTQDKIMLFLMLLAAGFDRDRMMKMEEMAQMDRKEAAKLSAGGAGAAAAGAAAKAPPVVSGPPAVGGSARAGGSKTAPAQPSTTKPPPKVAESAAPPSPPPPPPGSAAAPPPPPPPPGPHRAPPGGPPPGPPQGPLAGPQQGPPPGALEAGMFPPQQPENPEMQGSREVKMMELERIGNLRDTIFEMVKSYMQEHDRTMKDLLRSF